MRRKGQVWTADFVIGLTLFLVVVAVSISLIISSNNPDKYEYLYRDTVHLSSNLMSHGYPMDWNNTNVVMPGLLENTTRLSKAKLEEFGLLDYARTKNLLHTRNEYFFYFEDETGIINITKCAHGYDVETNDECEPELESLNYENLVRIERMLIHDSKLARMVVYSWN